MNLFSLQTLDVMYLTSMLGFFLACNAFMLASVVSATFFFMHVRVPPVGLQTLNVIDFFYACATFPPVLVYKL